MTYYEFDPVSGAFIGTRTPQADPLESLKAKRTVFALPGQFETIVPPPAVAAKQVPQWDGRTWRIAPDRRGEKWFDAAGNQVEIAAIGDPAEMGLTRDRPVMPPEPATVADVRTEASRRIQAAFGARDAAHLDIIIANATREVARLNQVKVGVPHPDGGWLVAPREWTAAERLRLAQLHAADLALEAIRAASNRLEAMTPVPLDYADDAHWG